MSQEPTPSDEAVFRPDQDEFRKALGQFATGVTIITAMSGGEPAGVAANSFTSVSLDPPLVLFCVARTSSTWPKIEQARKFAVNILGEHQESVSRVFAKRGEPEKGSLRGQGFTIGETGAPILTGCLAFLECRVAEKLEGGDHSIFLGEVVHQGVEEEMRPLVFFRGGYHNLA